MANLEKEKLNLFEVSMKVKSFNAKCSMNNRGKSCESRIDWESRGEGTNCIEVIFTSQFAFHLETIPTCHERDFRMSIAILYDAHKRRLSLSLYNNVQFKATNESKLESVWKIVGEIWS